jgi:hypothetical protein
MLEFRDGRICVQREDMERTELGKELLERNRASRYPWITLSEITGTEKPVRSIVKGPDWGRLELKLEGLVKENGVGKGIA